MTNGRRLLFCAQIFFIISCNGCTNGSADADATEKEGEYDDGIYHCCSDGDGTSCCESYGVGMCFKYGGVYEACLSEGELFNAKVICSICCNGLVEKEPQIVTDEVFDGYAEGCGPSDVVPPDNLICVACGNGECGLGENRCICPEDCR